MKTQKYYILPSLPQGRECPNRRPPIIAVDPRIGKIYEGAAMCSETDKFCLLDENLGCDTYNELLKEL